MHASVLVDPSAARIPRAIATALLLHLGAFALGPPVLISPDLPERPPLPAPPVPEYTTEEEVLRERPTVRGEAVRPELPAEPDPGLIEPDAPPPPPPPPEALGGGTPTGDPDGWSGRFVVWVDDPVVVRRVPPEYPDLAQRAEATGTVEVVVTIDREGFVRDAAVLRSSAIGVLEDAALDAARRWRFRPARQRGVAVEARTVLRFRFSL